MLGYLHHLALAVQLHFQSFFELRKIAVGKGHIYNRSHDLYNGSLVFMHSSKNPLSGMDCPAESLPRRAE